MQKSASLPQSARRRGAATGRLYGIAVDWISRL